VCGDIARNQKILLVVARDSDLDAIEKSGSYKGKYFVLGGTIPILEKEPEKRVALRELVARAAALAEKGLAEIVLALSANTEGENTANEAARALAPLAKKRGIKISTLGRGLSTGSELEYCDSETLKNALKNRV
jgi:recombination protein RecR